LGASLEFLPESELPADLGWADTAPNIAGAFAGFASVIDGIGGDLLPAVVRACIREHVQAWDGKDPGLGRHWVERALNGFGEASKAAARLTLLTAMAPHHVNGSVVHDFARHFPGDDKLLGALAWASFTSARRIGSWLHVS